MKTLTGKLEQPAVGRSMWLVACPDGWSLGGEAPVYAVELSPQPIGYARALQLGDGTRLALELLSPAANTKVTELLAQLVQLPRSYTAEVILDDAGAVQRVDLSASQQPSAASPAVEVTVEGGRVVIRVDEAELITGQILLEESIGNRIVALVTGVDPSTWDLSRFWANPVVFCPARSEDPVGSATLVPLSAGDVRVEITLGTAEAVPKASQIAACVAERLLGSIVLAFEGNELLNITIVASALLVEARTDSVDAVGRFIRRGGSVERAVTVLDSLAADLLVRRENSEASRLRADECEPGDDTEVVHFDQEPPRKAQPMPEETDDQINLDINDDELEASALAQLGAQERNRAAHLVPTAKGDARAPGLLASEAARLGRLAHLDADMSDFMQQHRSRQLAEQNATKSDEQHLDELVEARFASQDRYPGRRVPDDDGLDAAVEARLKAQASGFGSQR